MLEKKCALSDFFTLINIPVVCYKRSLFFQCPQAFLHLSSTRSKHLSCLGHESFAWSSCLEHCASNWSFVSSSSYKMLGLIITKNGFQEIPNDYSFFKQKNWKNVSDLWRYFVLLNICNLFLICILKNIQLGNFLSKKLCFEMKKWNAKEKNWKCYSYILLFLLFKIFQELDPWFWTSSNYQNRSNHYFSKDYFYYFHLKSILHENEML